METAKNISKLNQFLDRLDRYFKVTGWIAGGLAFVMMFALVREVGGRYFFNSPTDWAIDINAFLFVVMVYLDYRSVNNVTFKLWLPHPFCNAI